MTTLQRATMRPRTTPVRPGRSGFSLVEMLFAIFLLGIGVISIASLFPVGLTQQRRSADDITGPTIANNALEVIRSKVSAEDFGWILDAGNRPALDPIIPTITGDTKWRRPAFHFDSANSVSGAPITPGSIDLFYGSQYPGATADTNTEIPYNVFKWGSSPPQVLVLQEERYYPQQSTAATVRPPAYVWDCAFRRFQGRIQVAIFVYRVSAPGGEAAPYVVAPDPNSSTIPPLPHANLLDGAGTGADDPWNIDFSGDGYNGNPDDAIVPGTLPGDAYDPADYAHGWQAPGQWVLDNNNNIHRVLSGRRNDGDGPVELTRPPQSIPFIPVFSFAGGQAATPVFELMYIPPGDANGWSLTPVYVTVREL